MAQTMNATEQFLGSMKGILAIHKKMLPALKDFNKAQEKSLVNQTKMITLMEKTKPIVDTTNATKALAEAMADLGKSSEDATKKTERVETGLGKFIKNVMRAQDGPAGIIHKMMYGVSGYFIFKNRLDTLLSGIDTYMVRPLSGLKGEDSKQGMIGKMFFGIGGSYRKTQEQLKSVAKGAKGALDLVGEQATHNILGIAEMANPDYKSPLAKGKDKFMKSKIIPMADKLSKFEKRVLDFYKSTDKKEQIGAKLEKSKEKYQKFNNYLSGKGKKWMKSAGSALKSVGIMGVMALKFFVGVTIALIAVFLVVTLLKNAGLNGEKLKEIGLGMWEIIKYFAGEIWSALLIMKDGLMGMYEALMNGDVVAFVLAWLNVIWGFMLVVWNLFLMIAIPLFWGMVEAIKVIINGVYTHSANFIQKKWDAIMHVLFVIGFIVTAIAAVAAIFLTSPAWITAAIGTAIVGGVMMLIGALGQLFNPFAAGGVTKSGMSLVGEKGPELVRLPKGSRVHSNQESKQMMSGGGGNNITVNVQGRIGASDSELRLIAQKVGQMINKEINRTTSSRGLGA
tara:strand:- start:2371 stop:4065 length:1695 start_codon:yes stop_codon:yes gene_type:complete